jgi:hypothetical protein
MANAKITVNDTGTGAISITVDPEPFNISGTSADFDFEWTLDTSTASAGWTFASKGIDIKGPASVFKDRGPSTDKKTHGWKRKSIDNVKYKYTIKVENADGTTLTWDPHVVNN